MDRPISTSSAGSEDARLGSLRGEALGAPESGIVDDARLSVAEGRGSGREQLGAPESGIVEVMNYGRDRPGMIPLWAGEGDLLMPDFIVEGVAASLRGRRDLLHRAARIPDLREALLRYRRSRRPRRGGRSASSSP